MQSSELSGCAVFLLGGLCLMNLRWPLARKMGIGLIWLASAAAAYFLTRSMIMAGAMLLAWVFFPVWEMVFVLRQLRVPRHRGLADARAPREAFQELSDLTGELREAGFEQIDECRLNPSDHEQYYRLFDRGGRAGAGHDRLHRPGRGGVSTSWPSPPRARTGGAG